MMVSIWFPFLSSFQLIAASITELSHSGDSAYTDHGWRKWVLNFTGISFHLLWLLFTALSQCLKSAWK